MQTQNEQNAILNVFNFTTEDLIQPKSQKSDIFSPTPEKGKAGVYDAIVRFIPWHLNVKNSILKKSFFCLEHPISKQKIFADCPSNVNEPSVLQDIFWKFKNDQSLIEKAKADKFKRSDNFYSIVQIVKDENTPENVGKLMIFKYGFKIHEMILGIMQPKFGDKRNPFDLFNGPLFGISVKKAHGWNNYDDCKFIDNTSGPLFINGKAITPDDMELIKTYLADNSPNLEEVAKHVAWDADKTAKVNEIIKIYLGGATNQASVQSTPVMPNVTEQLYVQPQQVPQQTVVNQSQPVAQPVSQPISQLTVAPETVVTQPAPVNEGMDALAALYGNL